jgi:hypothetical protein
MSQVACPSCGVALDRAPKRRSQCVHCSQPILVRKGRLSTEDEARAIDVCSRLALPLERLWEARGLLSQKWGRRASAADAAWRVLNEVIVETPDFHGRGMVYFHMARFLWEEGRDHLQVARQCRQMRPADWKQAEERGLLDLKRARIEITTAREASCPVCRALEGTQFTYEEAVERNQIPVAECTHEAGPGRIRGWCRCDYVLHP